ncbi:MAG: MBL fold metallo-hydrolase [Pseudobdellovibrionaceae bacterium]|jgi:phosphoribosyl 1,2-cyclic phosphate phosphodiesterase|nr:MBL fold metallo-hydrolase [Pseudobdellovibrionaceae bacterium]
MSEKNKDCIITILGCGDSAGVPRVGGDWGACDPLEPRNCRTRPSIAVSSRETTLVVDTGADFRHQMNREKILKVDGVLYTHGHSDHVNGADELRFIHMRDKSKRIPVYSDRTTFQELKLRFGYIFEQKNPYYPPVAEFHLLDDLEFGKPHSIGNIEYIPFLQDHGQGTRSLGFRFGDVAYSTDMAGLSDRAVDVLKGIKVWIVDCADYHRPDFIFHSNIPNLLRLREKIGVETLYLTHLRYDHDYQTLVRDCPVGLSPAYDGMKIRCDGAVL